MLDRYLRALKVLCKGEIYKDANDELLDLWQFYQTKICPVIAKEMRFDLRYTGKYLFISMFLESDLGLKVPRLP